MAPRKKQRRNVKVVTKKNIKKKKGNQVAKLNSYSSNIDNIARVIKTLAKAPFLVINKVLSTLIKILKEMFFFFSNLVKLFINFISGIKEAFFSILFGLLAGGLGAVVIFSYLDLNSQGKNELNDIKILENEKIIASLKNEIENNKINLTKFAEITKSLNKELEKNKTVDIDNKNTLNEYNRKVEELFSITEQTNLKILKIEEDNENKISRLQKEINNTDTK